jgi:hypothetical protein
VKKTSKRTAASPKPLPRRRPSHKAPHQAALLAFARLAKKLALRWYVFGAQAVNLYGYPRATADLDLTIDLGERTAPSFVAHLVKAGFDPQFVDDEFIAATRVIPVVHRTSGLPIDLVLAGPGLEQMFLDETENRKLEGVTIPVLSLENLIVTKVLAARPRDQEDIRELIATNPSVNHHKVETTLGLVEEALGQSDLLTLYMRLRSEPR